MRKKAVKSMIGLAVIGIVFFSIITFVYLSSLWPLIGVTGFYIFSVAFVFWFYRRGEQRTPERISLSKDSFSWTGAKSDGEIKYPEVSKVERINSELYIVHYEKGGDTNEVYLHWAIAEEIEDRAGFYPWGSKDIKIKRSLTKSRD